MWRQPRLVDKLVVVDALDSVPGDGLHNDQDDPISTQQSYLKAVSAVTSPLSSTLSDESNSPPAVTMHHNMNEDLISTQEYQPTYFDDAWQAVTHCTQAEQEYVHLTPVRQPSSE